MDNGSQKSWACDLAAAISTVGGISVARYFGGYRLASGGVQFAFVMKGSLFLRADSAMSETLKANGSRPFAYNGASNKRVRVKSYWEAPSEIIEDIEALNEWAARAHRAAVRAKSATSAKRGAAV